MPKIKPILFNAEMTRRVLEDHKTATRRVVRPRSQKACGFCVARNKQDGLVSGVYDCYEDGRMFDTPQTPPYSPGDILYVRETFHQTPNGQYWYKADNLCKGFTEDGFCIPRDVEPHETCKICEYYDGYQNIKWHPSIHMPRDAARIFLRVTEVRVERLLDITVDGIIAEGVDVEIPPICKRSIDPDFSSGRQRDQWKKMTETQREEYVQNLARHVYMGWCDYADRMFIAFQHLWNSTIKDTDLPVYGWDANPWVWAIGFERISKEEAVNG